MKKETKKKKTTNQKNVTRGAIFVTLLVTCAMGAFALSQMNRVNDALQKETPFILPAAPSVTDALSDGETKEFEPTPAEPVLAETDKPEEPAAVTAGAKPAELIFDKPVDGEISLPFSLETLVKSKTLNDWRVHSGIDMTAKTGAEVKAVADGKVEQTYFDPQMGYTIVVGHDGDVESIYQNLASIEMVQAGMQVTRGQCIAAVGNSAAAELLEDSHLHFAVKAGEHFVDPMGFMK